MKFSLNLNKIALFRNARGENYPSLEEYANKAIELGVDGLTLHPRPDHRHATSDDVISLAKITRDRGVEFNIEGNPIEKFVELVCNVKQDQVTLVPDSIDALTSNAGWDTLSNRSFLKEVITEFKNNNIRTSIFIDTNHQFIEGAKDVGADRIELYTESYAVNFEKNNLNEIKKYIDASFYANSIGLGVNAGHDG